MSYPLVIPEEITFGPDALLLLLFKEPLFLFLLNPRGLPVTHHIGPNMHLSSRPYTWHVQCGTFPDPHKVDSDSCMGPTVTWSFTSLWMSECSHRMFAPFKGLGSC